jgi:hypothetical protein
MSRYNSIVPVPLGEIRRLDGKLGASTLPGQLVTAVDLFAAGSSKHAQSDGAAFTLNTANNRNGVLIVMEQEELVLQPTSTAFASGTHVRAHVLKQGEEATVILAAAAAITSGTLLGPAANGKVEVADGTTGAPDPMFSAIETASTASTGDDLRILARVL